MFARTVGREYEILDHSHDVFQWYCVVDGNVEMRIEGEILKLSARQGVLIPAGVSRAPRCGGRSARYIVAIFEAADLIAESACSRVLDIGAELEPDLLALALELESPGDRYAEPLMEALLLRILVGLIRASREGVRALGNQGLVNRVDAFIQANLWRGLTRDDIAKALKVSAPHLARTYRNATNKTLGERVTELRLAQAQALLTTSTLSVTEIATEVGLSSFSHFSQLFKARTGQAPSEYRKRPRR
jgi:AraC-like DNA-binding protein